MQQHVGTMPGVLASAEDQDRDLGATTQAQEVFPKVEQQARGASHMERETPPGAVDLNRARRLIVSLEALARREHDAADMYREAYSDIWAKARVYRRLLEHKSRRQQRLPDVVIGLYLHAEREAQNGRYDAKDMARTLAQKILAALQEDFAVPPDLPGERLLHLPGLEAEIDALQDQIDRLYAWAARLRNKYCSPLLAGPSELSDALKG